jgi:HK97 family phage major capsid protein/HK97 family phage prohead protease
MNKTLAAHSDAADPFLFVASTGEENRYGFNIDPKGWDLAAFRKNPIALWMHDHQTPVGTWENVKVEGGRLMARLKLAARGTSEFIDTLWSLMEQGIIRATSVGFAALEYKEDPKTEKLTVTKAELREISLVSVPADKAALRVMSKLSADMRARIFLPKGATGETAKTPPSSKGTATMSLAERIRAMEAELSALQANITTLTELEEMTDEQVVQLETDSATAETVGARLSSLKRAEAALASNAKSVKPGGGGTVYAAPKKERQKAELLFRSAYVIAKAHVGNLSLADIIKSDFGGDRELEAITLAASNPAMTAVQGWAAELIETQLGEFLDLLRPESVWAALAGLRVTFDRTGAIRLPGRTTRTLAGSFVGEGAPIPVKQALLSSILIAPFKMAVITTMTRELAQRSAPAAEPLFRNMMIEDTAVAIDAAFMDNAAASAVRPAGLQTLGSGSASAGSTVANIVADLRDMVQDMITAGAGRRPVWVMNEIRRIGLMTALSTTEDSRPFAAEISQGRLLGYPIVTSITVPSDIVFLIDQAELVQGYGDSPAIDMSNQATLHMEDTNPLPLVTGAQGSGVAASPMRSLFQTDSLGLRLIWDITWNTRRAGAVQFKTGVAW